MYKKLLLGLVILSVNTAWAGSTVNLSCAGDNIEVTFKRGVWPFSSDKLTFKDKVRKLELTAGFAITSDAYGIEERWVRDGDIVFQLSRPNDYTPYAVVLNSYDMKEARNGDKVTIGFSANYQNKFRDYRCIVK